MTGMHEGRRFPSLAASRNRLEIEAGEVQRRVWDARIRAGMGAEPVAPLLAGVADLVEPAFRPQQQFVLPDAIAAGHRRPGAVQLRQAGNTRTLAGDRLPGAPVPFVEPHLREPIPCLRG